jgi:hypothetical protein
MAVLLKQIQVSDLLPFSPRSFRLRTPVWVEVLLQCLQHLAQQLTTEKLGSMLHRLQIVAFCWQMHQFLLLRRFR